MPTSYTHTYRWPLEPALPYELLVPQYNGTDTGGTASLSVGEDGYDVTFTDRSERRVQVTRALFCGALGKLAEAHGLEAPHSVEVSA